MSYFSIMTKADYNGQIGYKCKRTKNIKEENPITPGVATRSQYKVTATGFH